MIDQSIVEGRLTGKPNIYTSQSGLKISRFTIASDQNRKTRNGKELTFFVNCVMFGNRNRQGQITNTNINNMSQFVPVGGLISVLGSISESRYQSKKTGQMKYSQPLTVYQVNYLNTHIRGGQSPQNRRSNYQNRPQPNNYQNNNSHPMPNPNNRSMNRNNGNTQSSQPNPNRIPAPQNRNQGNKKVDISDDDLPF